MYYDVNLEIDYKAIGRRIKAAREKKKLKPHNLAALAEIAATNLSHIERGVTKVSLPTLLKIANSLEVSMDELLCDSLTKSKHIYEAEIAEIVEKCSDKEVRVMAATVTAMYEAMHGKIDG